MVKYSWKWKIKLGKQKGKLGNGMKSSEIQGNMIFN
jgi:hypothetical protein